MAVSSIGRKSNPRSGYGRSDVQTFSIPDTETGSESEAIDLIRNYGFIVVRCEDAQYIPAGTTLTALVGETDDDELVSLYRIDGESVWVSGELPTANGFRFQLNAAFGIQRILFLLSNAADGGAVDLQVIGLDPALAHADKFSL